MRTSGAIGPITQLIKKGQDSVVVGVEYDETVALDKWMALRSDKKNGGMTL